MSVSEEYIRNTAYTPTNWDDIRNTDMNELYAIGFGIRLKGDMLL